MGYLDELEKKWRATKKKNNENSLLQDRPSALRGRDFVTELTRLSVLTKDSRFHAAIEALLDHGIVDRSLNFTRWVPNSHASRDRELKLIIVNTIDIMVRGGMSVRRAAAELAANIGTASASFEAARKQLEILYTSGRSVPHDYSNDSK